MPLTSLAVAAVLCASGAGCAVSATAERPGAERPRARGFVGTFDRVLVAGFLEETVTDGGREINIDHETARLLRMMLRSRASLNVVESVPLHLPSRKADVFDDVALWKRIGEEYREPLLVTGTVRFRRAGPQSVERQAGPRTVTMSRPRFRLELQLVFISGRTGEVLERLTLPPFAAQARDGRTSALALYFELMDRLAPSVLAVFGQDEGPRRASR